MNADLTSFFNFKLLKEFVKLRGKVIILHIEKVIIRGYKTFQDFEMEFNKGYNVIIGDNEAGKSTVLEALDIVLNQSLFNFERSEEHTSELQSRGHLVCRLLLEKKNKK